VIGCRSEQTSTTGGFIKNLQETSTVLINCSSSAAAHDFCHLNGAFTLTGCWSDGGRVVVPSGNGASVFGSGNRFGSGADAVPSWSSMPTAHLGRALMSGFDGHYWRATASGALPNAVFSRLPSAAQCMGAIMPIVDSSTATAGATITGGGANFVYGVSNGTNWIVSGADRAW
jgi:hypothetical protein